MFDPIGAKSAPRRPRAVALFISAAVAAATAGGGALAEPPPPASLSLKEALSRAPTASRHVAAAQAQVAAAERRLGISRKHLVPSRLQVSGGARVDFDGTVGPDVSVGWIHTIERADRVDGREGQARAQLAIATAGLNAATVRARVAVAQAWASLQAASLRRSALERIAELNRSLADAVDARVKVGVSTAPERAAVLVSALDADTRLQAAQIDQQALAEQLRVLLNQQHAVGGGDVSRGAISPPPLSKAIHMAIAASGLRALRDGQAARSRAAAARWRGQGQGNIGVGFSVGLERNDVVAKALLQMPLGGGSRPDAEADVNEKDVALAEAALQDAEQTLTAQVTARWHRWSGHQARADALQETAGDVIRNAQAITEESLKAGRATIVALITMQQQSAALSLTLAEARAEALKEGAILMAMTQEVAQ